MLQETIRVVLYDSGKFKTFVKSDVILVETSTKGLYEITHDGGTELCRIM